MTETQNQKSEIMNIDMHDTPLHKWERELNEAQKRGDEYGQKYAKTMLERDQLKAELAEAKSRLPHVGKPYMDLWRDVDRLAQEVAGVMVERDQLKAEVERLKCADFCQLTKPGRGDCEHFIGLPGISIPGQHDGPDDTKDCYDKPNGWCWACWRSYENSRLRTLVASYEALSEEVGTEFEGVDEVKEVIRLLKQERDQLKAEVGHAVNTLLAGAQHNVPACVTAALARFNDMEKNP